jgi:hypothetical protein
LWRDREWRFLLNLIDHLPPGSFFVEALSDDEEYATAALASGGQSNSAPRMSTWSPVVDMLAVVNDRLGLIAALQAAANGGRQTLPPVPRPSTAFDRVRHVVAREKHRALVAKVLPASRPR